MEQTNPFGRLLDNLLKTAQTIVPSVLNKKTVVVQGGVPNASGTAAAAPAMNDRPWLKWVIVGALALVGVIAVWALKKS